MGSYLDFRFCGEKSESYVLELRRKIETTHSICLHNGLLAARACFRVRIGR